MVVKILHVTYIYLFAYLAIVAIHYLSKRKKYKSIEQIFMKNLIEGLIVAIAIVLILLQFEGTTNLLKLLLACSALIGYLAQESLNNFLHGLSILLFKPIQVGQRITLKNDNITGIVISMTLRHVVIRTYNNSFVCVPNSRIDSDNIENFHSVSERSKGFIDITVDRDSDVDVAINVMKLCISHHPLTIYEDWDSISVYVRDIDNNGYYLRAEVWTEDINSNFDACSDIRIELLKKFNQFNIEMSKNRVAVNE